MRKKELTEFHLAKKIRNPVLPAGDREAWDDGGFSEAGVLYHDGVFHIFCGFSRTAHDEVSTAGLANVL